MAVPRLARRRSTRRSCAQRLWLEHYVQYFATVESNNAVLPAAGAGDLREVARPHAAGLPVGGEGQPLPHPHQAAARAAGAGGPADGAGRRLGDKLDTILLQLAADAEGRPRPAAATASPAVPGRAPGSPSSRGTTAGGPTTSAHLLERYGAALCWADRDEQPSRPAVADRRLGLPALPPRRRGVAVPARRRCSSGPTRPRRPAVARRARTSLTTSTPPMAPVRTRAPTSAGR